MRLGVALYIFASLPVGKSYRVVNELKNPRSITCGLKRHMIARSVIELREIEGVDS
jgi:hypothetical protein